MSESFTESDLERDVPDYISEGDTATVENFNSQSISIMIGDQPHENWMETDNYPLDNITMNQAFVVKEDGGELVFEFSQEETEKIQSEVEQIMSEFKEQLQTPEEFEESEE
jgi:hypothetical protein